VKKYGADRQATDDNIIRRMRFVCWITKATDTHECVNLTASPLQQWLNAPQYYVIRTLPLSCMLCFVQVAASATS
jgi:hypothetical protein